MTPLMILLTTLCVCSVVVDFFYLRGERARVCKYKQEGERFFEQAKATLAQAAKLLADAKALNDEGQCEAKRLLDEAKALNSKKLLS